MKLFLSEPFHLYQMLYFINHPPDFRGILPDNSLVVPCKAQTGQGRPDPLRAADPAFNLGNLKLFFHDLPAID